MPEIVLFGATGYTGRLTAAELHRRGASFAIAGRSRSKLEALAASTGSPEIKLASVGDPRSLVDALKEARVLITCVGPFSELGDTAVEAALEAGVHYVDSTGETTFVDRLISRYDKRARDAGVALAPASGFDEVPADLAATLATDGIAPARLVLTYALPPVPSTGTLKTTLGIFTATAPFLSSGRIREVGVGELARWSPLPQPLGPRHAISFPLAETRLAPLHLDLDTFETYVTAGRVQRAALRLVAPALGVGAVRRAAGGAIDRLSNTDGPGDEARRRSYFTILAEARSIDGALRHNVVLMGADVYGITAATLVAAAENMVREDFEGRGVISPVQALGRDNAEKELRNLGVEFDTIG